jgi:hypothetical protein
VSEATINPVRNLALNPSRRQFAALGAVAAIYSGSAAAAPLASNTKPLKTGSLKVTVDGNLFRPEAGEHPGLVMFASAAAANSANAAVAHQLASQGWAVLLVATQVTDDPDRINQAARKHIDWLVTQSGVAAVPAKESAANHGYSLHSFGAAQPRLSLASRDERRSAAASAVLFAAPAALLAKHSENLNAAARALHRFSS